MAAEKPSSFKHRQTMTITRHLQDIQTRRNSLLCIGLDVDPEKIPEHLKSASNPVLEFNRQIIEATSDLVCAYKPNLAFYEAMGTSGFHTLHETRKLIPSTVLTIGDGKRGDIGNTAERYAKSLFDDLGFDFVTVNPYMGFDSVEPFLSNPEKGVFILALTSNPGSKDFQRLTVGAKPLYEKIVRTVKKWNQNQNIGLVVGATHPKELQRIRSIVTRDAHTDSRHRKAGRRLPSGHPLRLYSTWIFSGYQCKPQYSLCFIRKRFCRSSKKRKFKDGGRDEGVT